MNTIWIDKETTGLSFERNDTTQIAAILDIGGDLKEELNLLLRPSDPSRVEAGALAVQKKTLEQVMAHPLSQKEGYEAYRDTLAKWTKEQKASWAGQNCPFDVGFAKALFKAHNDEGGLSRYFNGETIDTLYIANSLKSQRKLMIRNAKLSTLCEAVGVSLPADKAHDALADIRATRLVFLELKKRFLEPCKSV